ncbi:MAG: hypothetical protein ACRD2Z_04355 [Thermoanaerobaculia bacterium]
MASLLTVTCNACSAAESEQIDEPVMMGFNLRCDRCGETTFVALDDLFAGGPPGIELASDEAWRLRYERLPTVAGTCSCGGDFREDAPLRCLSCRSTDVTSVMTGIAD